MTTTKITPSEQTGIKHTELIHEFSDGRWIGLVKSEDEWQVVYDDNNPSDPRFHYFAIEEYFSMFEEAQNRFQNLVKEKGK